MVDFHIAICGAGPVSQCLALFLVQHGIPANQILLLDAKTSTQAIQDARSIALSYGSQQILATAGVWPIKATNIRQIHVSRRGHFGRSLIDCSEYAIPALGYVARYSDIVTPLEFALTECGIQIRRPNVVTALEENDQAVVLTLKSGEKITAAIVVQAEGGTFGDQAPKERSIAYKQTAVIAHITVSQAFTQRAFERFTEQGPLALLPQDDGYALVWCVRPTTAEQLLALGDGAFKSALQTAFGGRLGQILTASPRQSYPLGLNVQTHATQRIVTIGNAAQTLHPVAGQGLNLGLRDAKILGSVLTSSSASFESARLSVDQIGATLQRFVKERQIDRQRTIRLTDILANIFASAPDGALTQSVLGASLGLLDLIKPAKKILAEQMMYGYRS